MQDFPKIKTKMISLEIWLTERLDKMEHFKLRLVSAK